VARSKQTSADPDENGGGSDERRLRRTQMKDRISIEGRDKQHNAERDFGSAAHCQRDDCRDGPATVPLPKARICLFEMAPKTAMINTANIDIWIHP
jgi:hypothetical protein